MEIRAWHSNHDYFKEAAFVKLPVDPVLNITHFALPLIFSAEDAEDAMLEAAFCFFNWEHVRDFNVLSEVREVVQEHELHTSMSVGDIVEFIDTQEFFQCMNTGWRKLRNISPQPVARDATNKHITVGSKVIFVLRGDLKPGKVVHITPKTYVVEYYSAYDKRYITKRKMKPQGLSMHTTTYVITEAQFIEADRFAIS